MVGCTLCFTAEPLRDVYNIYMQLTLLIVILVHTIFDKNTRGPKTVRPKLVSSRYTFQWPSLTINVEKQEI